jgi:hypothetical protein
MARIENVNGFNNLLFSVNRKRLAENNARLGARKAMDLEYKGEYPVTKLLFTGASQLNGKPSDLKYEPTITHSRPYYGYDAKIDPTILNSVRKKFVDVSGLLIANEDLPYHAPRNFSRHPLKPYGRVN